MAAKKHGLSGAFILRVSHVGGACFQPPLSALELLQSQRMRGCEAANPEHPGRVTRFFPQVQLPALQVLIWPTEGTAPSGVCWTPLFIPPQRSASGLTAAAYGSHPEVTHTILFTIRSGSPPQGKENTFLCSLEAHNVHGTCFDQ